MAFTLERQQQDPDAPGESTTAPAVGAWHGASFVAVGAVASLTAGVIHIAAVAAHSDHRQAVWAFLAIASAQLAWGAAALIRPQRTLAVLGVGIGAVAVVGWVLAKTSGVPFVDGLDTKEPIQFADGLAAGLAAVIVLSCAAALLARRMAVPRALTVVASVVILAVSAPGALAAVEHPHEGAGGDDAQAHAGGHTGADDAQAHAGGHTGADEKPEVPAAVPPRPFDPDLPIDLGGVDGVTPEQQARAENLLANTLLDLPQWADPAYAETKGFLSIGDGFLGEEHYINQEFMANPTILDPDEPESLVFDTTVTPKKLVAAMYMLTPGSGLETVPDIGGALTQWHIHNNLCFTAGAKVAGLTNPDGSCAAPLVKGPDTPMIHVWIEPHPCGPFSALEGIAGGQIAAGETRACDTVHGSHG